MLKHKFHAKSCNRGELKFSSKLERAVFDTLTILKNQGKILFILRQVPIEIGGGHKYFVDFLAFGIEECWFIEAKGVMTPLAQLKIDTAIEMGIPIHVIHDSREIYSLILSEK